MAEQPSRFDELMRQIRAGSEPAARELLTDYGDHVLRIIRRRLDVRMRRQFDSSDFKQAVWASFFSLPAERMTFRSPEELAVFLGVMAGNKVNETFRHAATQKRDILRERSLEDIGESNPCIVRNPEATPSQFVVADECWEQLNRGQSPEVQKILAMLREKRSYDEIARETGLHPKAIQRCLRRLKKDVT